MRPGAKIDFHAFSTKHLNRLVSKGNFSIYFGNAADPP